MKLGYIYTVTAGGYDDDKVRINSGEWSSVVEDERQLWLKYSSNGEAVAMTLVRDGLVIAIARIIGGDRADNNITTWVFIPSKIRITGSQLKQVIEAVKDINKRGTKKVTRDSFIGHEILNADYEEKKYQTSINPSVGTELAGRYPTTDYSLTDILGLPYQEYYTKYKYVFLVNQKSDLKEGLSDLSNKDIVESICVLAPSPSSIQNIFGTSTITIKFSDGRVFNSPITVKKGQMIDLVAEKKDCIPMRLKGQAVADEKEIEISAYSLQWRRVIYSHLFKVEDAKTGKGMSLGVMIEIPDPQYDSQNKSLPENRLMSVPVRITAKGYEPFEGVIDLSQGAKTIPLNKIIERETYICENEFGDEIKITVTGPGAKSQKPIRGYRVSGQKLIYSPKTSYDNHDYSKGPHKPHRRRFAWLEFCYGMLAVVLLALMCWCCVKLYDTFFDENISTSHVYEDENSINSTTASEGTVVAGKSSRERALDYLDNESGVWHRDSLNNYSELAGLFEDMNSYKFDKILERGSELQDSKKFQEVCNAIRTNADKHPDGKFCGDDDYSITISKYINKVNAPIESTEPKATVGVASETAKKIKSQSGAAKNAPVVSQPAKVDNDKNKGKKNGSVM